MNTEAHIVNNKIIQAPKTAMIFAEVALGYPGGCFSSNITT